MVSYIDDEFGENTDPKYVVKEIKKEEITDVRKTSFKLKFQTIQGTNSLCAVMFHHGSSNQSITKNMHL